MAKAVKGSDSKQGLIITLVFSILFNIGLGVFVYLGYAGQKEKEDATKKAEEEKRNSDADREWQKAQNLILKAYVGGAMARGDEEALSTLRGNYDQGQLKGATTGKEEFDKLAQQLDKEYGWDPATRKPKITLLDKVGILNKELATERQTNAANIQKWEQSFKNLSGLLAAAQKDVQVRQQANEEFEKKLKQYRDEKTQQYLESLKDRENLQNQLEADSKKNADSKAEQEKQADQLRLGIKDKDAVIEKLRADLPQKDYLANDRPKGKVQSIPPGGQFVYINLGSSDHVKPQLTFSVYGRGTNNKAKGERKAAVEVVNIIAPHLSQAKLTDVTDAGSNPVLTGDLLFNPAWSPSLKEHVAIAGLIDLTGDGTDSSTQFMRDLERQNIAVDYYLDLKTMTPKGKMTFKTGYLVVGEMPQIDYNLPNLEADTKIGRKTDVATKLSEIQDEAKRLGVTVVPARRFMDLIGYRMPKSIVPPDYTLRGVIQRPTENGAAEKKGEDKEKPEKKEDKKEPKEKDEK